jgi:hypothetical protein
MARAPVCHVSTNQDVTATPTGRNLPNIPRATDLASALAAIEAIRKILMGLTGQVSVRPPPSAPLPGSGAGFSFNSPAGANIRFSPEKKSNSDPKDNGRWLETERVTELKKIKNPDDPDQFIKVRRINKLVMRDSLTGEQWVFNAGNLGEGEGSD